VIRLGLARAVVPVVAPPRETGVQAAIEGCHGPWQAQGWARCHHDSHADLHSRAARDLAAHHRRAWARLDAAPPRRPFPPRWRQPREDPVRGHSVELRRTTEPGTVPRRGHPCTVAPRWPHRLVRGEVDVAAGVIACSAVRRWAPRPQPRRRTAPGGRPHAAAARGRCRRGRHPVASERSRGRPAGPPRPPARPRLMPSPSGAVPAQGRTQGGRIQAGQRRDVGTCRQRVTLRY
jgi:hypothetical protein